MGATGAGKKHEEFRNTSTHIPRALSRVYVRTREGGERGARGAEAVSKCPRLPPLRLHSAKARRARTVRRARRNGPAGARLRGRRGHHRKQTDYRGNCRWRWGCGGRHPTLWPFLWASSFTSAWVLELGRLFSSVSRGRPRAGPSRTAEYGDELAMGQWAPARRCTAQSFSVGVLGPLALGAGTGVWLSHRRWRCRLDGPSGGRSRHPLRVRVMQMQTHEGRVGVGGAGEAGVGGAGEAAESLPARARVCVKGSGDDGCPAAHPEQTAATWRGGGGGAARKARQAGAAGGSAVRRSAGKAPQPPGAPGAPQEMRRLLRRQDRDALMVSFLAGPPSCVLS